jgi:uncharacterized protein YegJ (DUF2314 family)
MRKILLLTFLASLLLSCRLLNPPPSPQPTSSDPIVKFSEDDVEMNNAIRQAQETLPLFIKALQSPTDTQTAFLVKARFPYDEPDNYEHMWINELAYTGDVFEGTLANEPVYVTEIRFGDRVTVKIEDISDWMIIDDHRMLGGFTLHVIRNNMSEDERAQFDAGLDFEIPDSPELP